MSSPLPFQVAIDGPAGAGKSTVARRVAETVGFTYVDTGAMYRGVAWAARERGITPDDVLRLCAMVESLTMEIEAGDDGTHVVIDGRDVTDSIRAPEISNLTSPLSAVPCVRERLAALQKDLGGRGRVVMEGRDIGTVVMPNAGVKVFLTASLEQRALRRQAELAGRGLPTDLDSLAREIAERDSRDAGRALAPLAVAPDAVVLDTDSLSADDVVDRIVAIVREAIGRDGG